MVKWRRTLAQTSVSYPTSGSFYNQYFIIANEDIWTSYDCKYVFNNESKQYELQAIKHVQKDGKTIEHTILGTFEHDSNNMAKAKALCVKCFEEMDGKI